MLLYLRLFYEFFKTGLFAVGGGLATLPFLYAMSDATGWFTHQQLADMVAISESTPGPIGVNMATYVGYTTGSAQWGPAGGILGGVIATLGLIAPSIAIIVIIAKVLARFKDNRYVQSAFYGLRPASVGMIAAAFLSILTMAILKIGDVSFSSGVGVTLDIKAAILAAAVYIGSRIKLKKSGKTLHPGVFLLASAIVGAVFHFAG